LVWKKKRKAAQRLYRQISIAFPALTTRRSLPVRYNFQRSTP